MFELLAQDTRSKARCGRLATAHGVIETPAFIPVGTQGTVKAVTPRELRELKAQIILGNTYHLFVRPGIDVIQHFGGLHKFMNWDGPILTDSGGYQIFSLAKLRKITEEGVHFQNHVDGTPAFISPEIAMEIQAALGSNIAMVLDECAPYPCDYEYAARSAEMTARWAARCKRAVEAGVSPANSRDADDTAAATSRHLVFGIVQGATFDDLRQQNAQAIVGLDFDGYAIGGVSVGEPEEEMMRAVESSEPFLPKEKPRYAMGLGTPPQLLEMIARGMDMFDCVLPTRLARNGTEESDRRKLHLSRLPGIHAWLHPASHQSRGDSRTTLDHYAQSTFLSRSNEAITDCNWEWRLPRISKNIRIRIQNARFRSRVGTSRRDVETAQRTVPTTAE